MSLPKWKCGLKTIIPPTILPFTKTLWHTLQNSLLDLLYPRLCLSCKRALPGDLILLCKECLCEISFSDLRERCTGCFTLLSDGETERCSACRTTPSPFYRILSALDTTPAAMALQNGMEQIQTAFLVKGCAAFIVVQLLHKRIPWPTLIVPAPTPPLSFLSEKIAFQRLLAEELGRILNVPVLKALKVSSELATPMLRPKKQSLINDQKILLVGPMQLPSQNFQSLGVAIAEGCPRLIVGVTFSASLQTSEVDTLV